MTDGGESREPGEMRPEDAFTWALRLFRAAADPVGFPPANVSVEGRRGQLGDGALRPVAEALALMPSFASLPLPDQRGLDRLAALFAWVFS